MFANVFAPKIPLKKSVRDQVLYDVSQRLHIANPLKAIVFGSFADGTANENSDIDILVVCRDDCDLKNVRKAVYSNLSGPITILPVEFIFVTSDDFERRKTMGGVCMIANEQGFMLFEAQK